VAEGDNSKVTNFSKSLTWIASQTAELLWPSRCAACDAFVPIGEAFCDPCQTSVTPMDDACALCATPCSSDKECKRCSVSPWPFASVTCATHYGGAVATALIRYKNGRQDLNRSLCPLILSGIAAVLNADDSQKPYLVMPVPLHNRRLRQRGFNQAWTLATAAVKLLPPTSCVELDPWSLIRHRDGKHVEHESITERLSRARGAFIIANQHRILGRDILLIDDVLTTGATTCACAESLLRAGANSVRLITVARTV
jgi:ComF family protein